MKWENKKITARQGEKEKLGVIEDVRENMNKCGRRKERKKERKRKQKKRCGKDTGGRINEHTTGKHTQERRLRGEKVQERERKARM